MRKILNESMMDIFGGNQEFSTLEIVVFFTTIFIISILTFITT